MQFSFILAAALAASFGSAAPTLEERDFKCPGIDSPLCCQLDVEGVIDTPCESPSTTPKTKAGFNKICAATGYTAMCCTVPLAGDGLVCSPP